jgi:ATP phosphoribosyltransferase regulatory subunit
MDQLATAAAGQDRKGARLERQLAALFAREGYEPSEPPVLQPAEAFLDVSGEDIRRRLFMTQDADGRDWCLRPEFTIPVCRAHLAAGRSGAAAYAYLGPVFRMRAGDTGEFRQAGVESLGREDHEAADAEVLALAIEAVGLAGLAAPHVRLGDVAVLRRFVEGLKLPAAVTRRLMRALAQGREAEALAELATDDVVGTRQHAGLLAAMQGQDPAAAKAFVKDVLAIAGISSVGGRSAADIAQRFLARAGEEGQSVPAEARAAISRCLAIADDPDSAAGALRVLAQECGVDLARELDALEARTGFMAARGLDVGSMRFSAGFARSLDYYTSFIFELHDPTPGAARPVAGGGRYDALLQRLGAPAAIPAVGVSIWLDRLPATTETAA